MEIFRLFGSIVVKDDASKEIDKVEKKSDSASEKITNTFKKIGGVIVAAFAFDKIKDFFVNIVENTSELEALKSQYEQVMGGMKASTDIYLDEMSKEWNKHPNELKNAMMQYYALLKSKGLSEQDAYNVAKQNLERTVDANAFANESMTDTTARFMAMMKGEYSSIDTAMINLNATMLDDAARKKYGKSLKDITETQKQMLISEIALKQHQDSGVFGQGVRESDSYANNMAMLKETWKDFTTIIGTPILEKVNGLLGHGVTLISNLSDIVTNYSSELQAFGIVIGAIAIAIGAYNLALNWTTISTTLATAASTAFGAVMAFITSPISLVIIAIGALIAIFKILWDNNEGFRNFVLQMWENIKTVFKQVLEGYIIPLINNVFIPLWNKIKAVFQQVFANYIIPFITGQLLPMFQKVFTTIGDVVKGAFNIIKWAWDTILKPLFVNIILPYIQNVLLPVWRTVFGAISGAISSAFNTIKNLWNNSLKPIFNGILDFISGVFTGNWKKAWEGIKSIFSGVFSGLKTIAKAPINAIIGMLNGFIKGINKIKIPDWVPGVGGRGINISTIPMLANGGTVLNGDAIVGEAGAELLRVRSGKATVIPLTNQEKKQGQTTGGITVNNYSPKALDEYESARQTAKALKKMGYAF